MAISLTPNLKLKLDDNLTADSKFNLRKIDTLGSIYQADSNGLSKMRSQADIVLEPNSSDIGGSGEGGIIRLGRFDNPAELIELNAEQININSAISLSLNDNFRVSLSPSAFLSQNIMLVLPTTVGTANQVLTTDGAGNLSWSTVTGTGLGAELSETWVAADGPIKTIVHNFNTRNVIVQILDDSDNFRNLEIDSVSRPTVNTVQLTSSVAPSSQWTVLIKQIN